MSTFVCAQCGAKSPSWVGKCPECETWNSYSEEVNEPVYAISKKNKKKAAFSGPVSMDSIVIDKNTRIKCGINEFDRVLGGGIIKGSVVLVAGEPGIGKSTLMLQLSGSLSKIGKMLYVCGEESLQQIKSRAERLSVNSHDLLLFPGTDLFDVERCINEVVPDFIIIDSIQTVNRPDISSGAGSPAQVKECAAFLANLSKEKNIPMFIVGQVTKDGSVAGPKMLEHMVDTVLYFEGEQTRQFRILRAVKNRFGSTNEVGIFEMAGKGLAEVKDPSRILIDEVSLGEPGSVVTVAIEGSRPLLVEVQALASYSKFASPKRVISGLDYNRSFIIIGVLERKAGIKLGDSDVYLSVASGITVEEPAADLPAAMAIASCVKNKGIDPKTVIMGEIGLTGEVRSISMLSQRISEAEKLGFLRAIVPKSNEKIDSKKIKIIGVSNIKEAIEKAFI